MNSYGSNVAKEEGDDGVGPSLDFDGCVEQRPRRSPESKEKRLRDDEDFAQCKTLWQQFHHSKKQVRKRKIHGNI
jgi:hypothetical protein